jgi:hypothetical protein
MGSGFCPAHSPRAHDLETKKAAVIIKDPGDFAQAFDVELDRLLAATTAALAL